MTRTGKMARLSPAIRDELNRRLADGGPRGSLLPWLNSLPPVRAMLERQFRGVAISKQNLSEWRKSGFAVRRAHLDLLAEARQFPAGALESNLVAPGRTEKSSRGRHGGVDKGRLGTDKSSLGRLSGESDRVQPGQTKNFSPGSPARRAASLNWQGSPWNGVPSPKKKAPRRAP